MLFTSPSKSSPGPGKDKSNQVFRIKAIEEVATALGITVQSARGMGPGYNSAMDAFAHMKVIVTGTISNSPKVVRVESVDLPGQEAAYQWRMEYLEPVVIPSSKHKKHDEPTELKESKNYYIILDSGTIVLGPVPASLVSPGEDAGFFIVDIRDHMTRLGASDWYTISYLCVSLFGEKERTNIYVHVSNIITEEDYVRPELPEQKAAQEKHRKTKQVLAMEALDSLTQGMDNPLGVDEIFGPSSPDQAY